MDCRLRERLTKALWWYLAGFRPQTLKTLSSFASKQNTQYPIFRSELVPGDLMLYKSTGLREMENRLPTEKGLGVATTNRVMTS